MIERPSLTGNLRTATLAVQPFGVRTLVLLGLGVAWSGCGGSRASPPRDGADVSDHSGASGGEDVHPPAPSAVAPAARPSAAPRPLQALRRPAVHAAITQGLGVLLQHVDLDDRPVRVGGKFHGFRIVALRDGAFWSGVDLKPGDVVTSVNGFPIERPEQAQTAFESLEAASELRVAYERDGQARELIVPIVDER